MSIPLVLAGKFLRLLHKFYHPVTIGARAIILNKEKDSVLLVKLSYAEGWYLPGGKLKRLETAADGLKRELREELNFTVDENDMALFGVYNNFYEGKSDTVIVFVCSGDADKHHKNVEIEKFRYFPLDSLPESLSPGTKRRLDEYLRWERGIVGEW